MTLLNKIRFKPSLTLFTVISRAEGYERRYYLNVYDSCPSPSRMNSNISHLLARKKKLAKISQVPHFGGGRFKPTCFTNILLIDVYATSHSKSALHKRQQNISAANCTRVVTSPSFLLFFLFVLIGGLSASCANFYICDRRKLSRYDICDRKRAI